MTHLGNDTWLITKLRNPGPGAGTDACSQPGTIGITEDGRHFIYTGVAGTPWVQILGVPSATMAIPIDRLIVPVPIRSVIGNSGARCAIPPNSLPAGAVGFNVLGASVTIDSVTDNPVAAAVQINGAPVTLGGVPVSMSIPAPGAAGDFAESAVNGANQWSTGDDLTVTITSTNTLAGGAVAYLVLQPRY